MATADIATPPPSRPRWRFTLGGLFVVIFGIGVGLAAWRLPKATPLHALTASVCAWLLAGLAQRFAEGLRRVGRFSQMPRTATWEHALDIVFTLSGLLVCVLTIGVSLGHWRLPGITAAKTPMACFSACLVIGMLQRVAYRVSQACQLRDLAREDRWGLALGVAAPLGIVVLIAVTAVVEFAEGFELPREWYEARVTSVLIYAAYWLAVICAYWRPPRDLQGGSAWQRIGRVVGDRALVALGIFWAGIALLNGGLLMALVHAAVRGVEAYQPTRLAGREFYPANFDCGESNSFFGGALAAAVLLFLATTANLLVICWWGNRRARYALLITAGLCLAAVVGLLFWCRVHVLPEFSPFLAAGVREQSLRALPLAFMLLLAVATTFSVWSVAKPQLGDGRFGGQDVAAKQFLEEYPAVIAVGLIGTMTGIIANFSQTHYGFLGFWAEPIWGPLTNYLIGEPYKLIGVAAALTLSQCLWAWWRGALLSSPPALVVEPGRFAAAWLATLVTLLLVAPVAAWAGSAILLRFVIS